MKVPTRASSLYCCIRETIMAMFNKVSQGKSDLSSFHANAVKKFASEKKMVRNVMYDSLEKEDLDNRIKVTIKIEINKALDILQRAPYPVS